MSEDERTPTVRDPHEDWYTRARTLLRAESGDEPWARSEIEAARRAVADHDGAPESLLGPAEDFARTRLDDRLPDELDSSARRRLADRATGALGAAGGFGVIASIRAAWSDGWIAAVDPRALVLGVGLISALLVAGVVPPLLRLAGRPRAGAATFVVGAAIAPFTVALVAGLPSDTDASALWTPLPALVLVALALAIWAFTVRPQLRATARADAVAEHAVWFTRLAGLLEGRHELDRRAARALADQAREHWALARDDHPTGSAPDVEFGTVQDYAADLAAGRRPRTPWWARPGLWGLLGGLALGYTAVHSVLDGSPGWEVVLRSALAALAVAGAVVDLRTGNRRGKRANVDA